MTDKEQIIIDGIQFNKFGDFYVDYDLNGKFQSISSSAKEYKILKSLIKQLARKTQESEELKEYLQANQPTGICETCMATTLLQNDKYRKALKTIEEICLNDVYTFAAGTQLRYDSLDDILDVINRLKEEL